MGRPWWYDSYWEKKGKPPRRRWLRLSRLWGRAWPWLVVLAVAALITWLKVR